MSKISIQQFVKMLEYDVAAKGCCIEVEFCIDEDPDYNTCWLGKTFDKETKHAVYWYGLVADGSQAYDFNSSEELLKAPVFRGKNIQDLWDKVKIYSIDGCSVEYRLPFYLGLEPGPHFSPSR